MPNSYYNHSTYPTPNSPGSSANMRSELELITTGFNLLPTLTGNGYKVAMVNSAGTALISSSALQGLAVTSSTVNSTVIGGTSAAAGTFTNITATGTVNLGSTVVITGGTINGTTIGGSVQAAGAFTTLSASGGITGSLTGNVTASSGTSSFTNVGVSGTLTATLTGNVTAASGTSTFTNVTINGTLDMNSGSAGTITGLAAPVGDSDAANKGYVDTVAQGLDAKASARAATTASITLFGAQTIDTVAVVAGNRVLVKDQGTASENGIYVASNAAWSRSTDADTWDELVSAFIFVEEGSAGGNNGYVCTIDAGGTLGVTAVTWAQFSGAGQITAGNGLTKSGNTLAVGTASASRIVVNADDIDLAASGVTVGTYKSVTVDAYGRVTGGSNPTTLAGYGITDAYTKTEIDSIFGSTTSAAASAAAAAISASNALTSEGNASTYAGNALTSANNAAASFDSFDDRYLGAKASNPSVDNDGNALLTGALYFNTTVSEMRVYSGSAWLTAYLPATGYVQKSGDTMTGSLAIATTDNVNAALRITQLGTGNALLVEDTTNPDASPFVIDATGRVIVGNTSVATFTAFGLIPQMQVLGSANNTTSFGIGSFRNDTASGYATFLKSRNTTVGTLGASVVNGDNLGLILWNGDDGTSAIQAAQVYAQVDGVPGTSSMPGRLLFGTTAAGGTTPTERMRISSAGQVGVGGNANAVSFYNARNITGNTISYANYSQATIQSDVTSQAFGYRSNLSTQATAFTLGNIYNFYAGQGTIGATSAVTTQTGFIADSSLTGATNNYGFYGNIASDTGRWNLYMNGTAANYLGGDTIVNGKIGLGTAASPSYGTAGQVLTSAGSGASPAWADLAASGPTTAKVYFMGQF